MGGKNLHVFFLCAVVSDRSNGPMDLIFFYSIRLEMKMMQIYFDGAVGRAGSWTNLAHAHSLAYSNQLRCQWGLLGNFCAPPYSSELPSI